MKKNGKHQQFLQIIKILSDFKYLFATSVKCSDYNIWPFFHKLAETNPFAAVAFIPLLNGKLDIKS